MSAAIRRAAHPGMSAKGACGGWFIMLDTPIHARGPARSNFPSWRVSKRPERASALEQPDRGEKWCQSGAKRRMIRRNPSRSRALTDADER
jgi:hypothetical protein